MTDDDPRRHRASQQMPEPLRGATWYLTPVMWCALRCGDGWTALRRWVRCNYNVSR